MKTIKYTGVINIEPDLLTNKHREQSEWKQTSIIEIGGDICDYYSWFIKKRYGLSLVKPLRGSHITFINDKISDFNIEDIDNALLNLKEKYHNKTIDVELDLDPRTNAKHWWFNVTKESRELIQGLRNEVGLDKPHFGLHMTIGRVDDKNIEHSEYILRSILKLGQ